MLRSTWTCVGVALTIALAAALAAAGTGEDVFQSLYGPRYAEAIKTPDKADDLALAKELLAGAQKTDVQREVIAVLCEKACDLCEKLPEGGATAVEAMERLAQAVPEKKEAAQERLIGIWDSCYGRARADERTQVGQAHVEALLKASQTKADAGKYDEAVALASRAARTAAQRAADMNARVVDALKALRDRQATAKKIEDLQAKLTAAPQDAAVRNALLEACVAGLDDPARAATFLTHECDEKFRTYVPLAVKNVDDVPEAACLEMGDWYRGLAAKPGAAKAAMLERAKKYYARYVFLHGDEDTSRTKAKLAAEQVDKDLAKLAPPPAKPAGAAPKGGLSDKAAQRYISPAILQFARERAKLPPAEQVTATATKLAEVNKATILVNKYEIDEEGIVSLNLNNNPDLVSIEPLFGLPLRELNLNSCTSLKSLNGVQGMPLTDIGLDRDRALDGDLTSLAGSRLRSLDVISTHVTSLNGLQGLPLESLAANVNTLADLAPLRGLALRELTLGGSANLGNDMRGLSALGWKLKKLVLRGPLRVLISLRGLESMPLEEFYLSNVNVLPPQGYAALAQIPTLGILDTGDAQRDEAILAACAKLRERQGK